MTTCLVTDVMLACSFFFGFHVHEKAILMVLIPLALNAADGTWAAGEYLFAAAVSTYSLFPLLYTPAEYPIKVRPGSCRVLRRPLSPRYKPVGLRCHTACSHCSTCLPSIPSR